MVVPGELFFQASDFLIFAVCVGDLVFLVIAALPWEVGEGSL